MVATRRNNPDSRVLRGRTTSKLGIVKKKSMKKRRVSNAENVAENDQNENHAVEGKEEDTVTTAESLPVSRNITKGRTVLRELSNRGSNSIVPGTGGIVAKPVEVGASLENGSSEEPAVEGELSPKTSPKSTATKSFYGQTSEKGLFDPESVRDRMREFSFAARRSFVATPEDARVMARNRVVKKRQGTRAVKSKAAVKKIVKELQSASVAKKGCCNRKRQPIPEDLDRMKSTLIELRTSPRKPVAGKRFFKHHLPASQLKVYYQGGILKVAPHTPSGKKQGKIPFDFKDNDISHLAEEGGKCDNFGLKSIDDLESEGVPRRSIMSGKGELRTRKRKNIVAPTRRAKRQRPSFWKYDEDKEPCKKPLAGPSLQQYEEAKLREEYGCKNLRVVCENIILPKSAEKLCDTPILNCNESPASRGPASMRSLLTPSRVASLQLKAVGGSGNRRTPKKALKVDIPSREPSPAFIDVSPIASPVGLPSMRSELDDSQAEEWGTIHEEEQPQMELRSENPPMPKEEEKVDPLLNAFGFDRKFKVKNFRFSVSQVHVDSLEPAALTPKPGLKQSQRTLIEVLNSSQMSTPMKRPPMDIPTPAPDKMIPNSTSTPYDGPNRVMSFYGGKSGKAASGFTGFKRLIDKAGTRQLQIDAGQKCYGAKECLTCGMVYSQNEAEDERDHDKFHNHILACLQFKVWKNGRVIDTFPDRGRVYLVTSQDPKYMRDKVADIMRLANTTIGFDEESIKIDSNKYPGRKFVFFASNSGKIVSLLAIDSCSKAFRTIDSEEEQVLVDNSAVISVKYCIFFAWTLPEYRRKGFASILFYKLRTLLAGERSDLLSLDDIAFADPTPDMKRFVCSVAESKTFLVAT